MNDKIYPDGKGGFETESFRRSKLRICECLVPEIRTKCSENGISSYCLKCSKSIKENNK